MKMKRTFCFAVIFLLSLSIMACAARSESKELKAEDNESENSNTEIFEGENFSATVTGGKMILDLASNATTGYTWVITKEPDQFASDYDVYVEPDKTDGMVGTGGITEFHIIALREGSGTMVFQYKRNWEGGEIAGTYELTLEISSDLQIRNVSFEQVE
ncbi:MAG: protease inhibitor I42 family protein [Clostridiales bacterium]|nr:protease inhibitor I42 family protein [Clostridiales bacterium]